ncbi:glutamyl-tRNA reductase [Avibacterium paragallinarum]|uniref:glutamyl-tRNA reductase n=1 Tax=Avibacterium paragallinarum TaxID=728 RepID=UPI0021F6AFA1|nr:glutamyl-tRNA reductase [Avibacterium paragallinarum]UXN33788.1 glutamyl-tRNA reductase [Avibacterium paragallinarum]UXN37897.1 glutamyl-tRNA reductase [Avibacterium paragallinarum]
MTILVLGINHKTASVSLREKVAFSDEKRQQALQQIEQSALADSAVILSTCNRTEVYFHNKAISPQDDAQWQRQCIDWLSEMQHIDKEELNHSLYVKQNQFATQHLMRVACGLDSLVLGEPQILGQVKQAYQLSEDYYQQHQGAISGQLSRLFQKTFSTAKRVRTETRIGENAISVAYTACTLARQIFDSLRQLNILLVGAGETIELVARHLLRHGVKSLTIANRTLARAEQLVEKLGSAQKIRVIGLNEIQEGLNQADIVISSTGSPNTLISQAMVQQAQKMRCYNPMLIVDIAVPRDVEESAGEVESVYHYTVDDLQNIIQRNLTQREQASAEAEQIIDEENQAFFEWLKIHQFSDLIRRYREEAEQTRQEMLEKALSALQQGESAEQILQELSYKLMNKLIHTPTQAMQAMMKLGNAQGLQAFSKEIQSEEK